MTEREQKRLDAMSPEQRAKAEAARARFRTPEARAATAAAMAAVEQEVRETGGIEGPDGRVHKVRLPDDDQAFALVQVGQSIRDLRNTAGLTLDDLARESGIDASTIAKIERGAVANPTVGTLGRVASAVGGRIKIDVVRAQG